MTEPTASVKVGVAFDLNGQPVSLQPAETLEEIKTKGLTLTLPQRIDLGKVGEGIDNLLSSLGSQYHLMSKSQSDPSKSQSDPDALQIKIQDLGISTITNLFTKVTSADLSVEKFHVNIPPSQGGDATATYTIGLAATWKADNTDNTQKISGLTLTGIYFEISNEE